MSRGRFRPGLELYGQPQDAGCRNKICSSTPLCGVGIPIDDAAVEHLETVIQGIAFRVIAPIFADVLQRQQEGFVHLKRIGLVFDSGQCFGQLPGDG